MNGILKEIAVNELNRVERFSKYEILRLRSLKSIQSVNTDSLLVLWSVIEDILVVELQD